MITASIDNTINKIVIKTDDPSVKCLLEFKRKVTKYSPWLKSWNTTEEIAKLYDNPRSCGPKKGIYTFILGMGWAAYIANVFKPILSDTDYNAILRTIFADSYRTYPFPSLRDYQNQDILFMLKYKRAIIQVNTSYGKTQCISVLAHYAHEELGKKVLIVAPNKKPREEIIKRYESLFGKKISTSLDDDLTCIITSGFLNQKKIKDPKLAAFEEMKLKKYQWVLVDEVEYTINDAGEWIYNRVVNAECMYSFSGTASKRDGRMITFAQGITDVVVDNKDLIKYFGPALVYRMPMNLDVTNVTIKTSAFEFINFCKNDDKSDNNIYLEILTKIWTSPKICELIVKTARRFPMLFIPINNLNNVIYEWIDKYFIGNLRTLLICNEGYIYYDLNGNKEKLDLINACNYIKNGMVDIIPSTSSGYRALDFPGLENILLIQGIVAGVTLQCIGRVARGTRMNIIAFEPKSKRKIPVYTKGFEHRKNMIQEYYKYCNMSDITINEEHL
jgi:hypothetical protein